jgi:hypothetical protein
MIGGLLFHSNMSINELIELHDFARAETERLPRFEYIVSFVPGVLG